MIERDRRELAELLQEFEVSSGEMDAATSDRLRRRLEMILDADPDQDDPEIGQVISFRDPALRPDAVELPPVPSLPESAPLPLYGSEGRKRRPRSLPAALSAAALVAAAVIAIVVLPSGGDSDSNPERRELSLPAVLAPVLAASPVSLPSDVTISYTTLQREPVGGTMTRRRDIHPDGTVTETVLDEDGTVLATFPPEPSSAPLQFGRYTYDDLRSFPATATELGDAVGSGDRTAALAEVAALPVTPPAVRAAAIEVLTDEGFTWHLDDGGLMIGSRGSAPVEEVAVDPATGRVTAYGWVDGPGASLLDSVRVTIWR